MAALGHHKRAFVPSKRTELLQKISHKLKHLSDIYKDSYSALHFFYIFFTCLSSITYLE